MTAEPPKLSDELFAAWRAAGLAADESPKRQRRTYCCPVCSEALTIFSSGASCSVCEWSANGTAAEIVSAALAAQHPPAGSLFEDAAHLLATPVELPREVIEGVLHEGCKMVLAGGSKSFKTWSLMDLAISVCSGSKWWNFGTTKGRVLYLNLEVQRPFFRKRLNMIAARRGIKLTPGSLVVGHLRGVDAETTIATLLEEAKRRRYALIIIDPYYKLAPGLDENAIKDVSPLLAQIDKIAEETSAAIAYGHHFSKGNQSQKESIDRMSGTGGFARDADAILTMTAHEEEYAYTVEMTLRNCPPVDPFVVRWEAPIMVPDAELSPERLKQTKRGPDKKYSPEMLLPSIGHEWTTTVDWKLAVIAATGMADGTFGKLKRQLEAAGKIEQCSISYRWRKP